MNPSIERRFPTYLGEAIVHLTKYAADGSLAVELRDAKDGEPIARLSAHMPNARPLPPECFYMKDWSENMKIARDAVQSGWFRIRHDLPIAVSGHVWADAFEVLDERLEGAALAEMLEELP